MKELILENGEITHINGYLRAEYFNHTVKIYDDKNIKRLELNILENAFKVSKAVLEIYDLNIELYDYDQLKPFYKSTSKAVKAMIREDILYSFTDATTGGERIEALINEIDFYIRNKKAITPYQAMVEMVGNGIFDCSYYQILKSVSSWNIKAEETSEKLYKQYTHLIAREGEAIYEGTKKGKSLTDLLFIY